MIVKTPSQPLNRHRDAHAAANAEAGDAATVVFVFHEVQQRDEHARARHVLADRSQRFDRAVDDVLRHRTADLARQLDEPRRRAAGLNLNSALEFERITELLVRGGEVAQVDLLRARLLTTARRDELEQARAGETAATESLRVLIGFDPTMPIAVTDLSTAPPDVGEVEQFNAEMIARRPELRQVDAQRAAITEEAKQARSERRPQITYSINGGFATDALRPTPLRDHAGVQATVGVTIPLFDWGASKSRERQAQLRLQTLDSVRLLALRSFNQQFATARAQARSAADRIRLARAGVADAERNLEISIARYRAGEAQIIEATDAQNTLTVQRAALNQAVFDYQVALTRLRQATGQ